MGNDLGIRGFMDAKISSLLEKVTQQLCYPKAMKFFSGIVVAGFLGLAILVPTARAQFEYIPIVAPETPSGEVDLIIEADTLKPVFYRGRDELIPGSWVKIVAVPSSDNFFNAPGLTYYWEIEGDKQASNSNVLTITVPNGREMDISVRVKDQNGRLFAESAKTIPVSSPFMVFYEDNPLRGTADVSFGESIGLLSEEVSIRAVPFFMDRSLSNSLTTNWRVDRSEVVNGNTDPYVITLQAVEDGKNNYNVNFDVFNKSNPLQRALGEFRFINRYE